MEEALGTSTARCVSHSDDAECNFGYDSCYVNSAGVVHCTGSLNCDVRVNPDGSAYCDGSGEN